MAKTSIILKKNTTNLGVKNDLVEVKRGYAEHYLIPQQIAVLATDQAIKVRNEDLRQLNSRRAKEKQDASRMAGVIQASEITLSVKAGAEGRVYGTVTSIQIAAALKDQKNIAVAIKQITLEDPITSTGTHKAMINLHPEVNAILALKVVAS